MVVDRHIFTSGVTDSLQGVVIRFIREGLVLASFSFASEIALCPTVVGMKRVEVVGNIGRRSDINVSKDDIAFELLEMK